MGYKETLQQIYQQYGMTPPASAGGKTVITSQKTAYQTALDRAQQKQQAIIAGLGTETARNEHIVQKNVENFVKQKQKEQAVIFGTGSEAARREHIAQKAPSYEVVRNGMYSFAMENDPQKKASYAGQMKNLAQKQYDAYVGSAEYAREKERNLRLDMLDVYSASETAGAVQPRQDQKEVELKTMVDFWTQQENEQNNKLIKMQDVQELLSWSEEDREKMRLFNENRAGRLSYFSASADQANTRQVYENAERLGLARAAEKELAQKYGEQRVQEIAESLSWWQNELKTNAAREKYSNVEDGFWPGLWASIEGRAYNAAGSVTGTLGQLQNLIIKPTGRYSTLDPNNLGNLPNVMGQALTGAVAENIRGEKPTAGREALAAIYKAGMTSADSLIRAYMGGGVKGISRALIASSAFGNAMAEYSAQGASPMEAVLMSTVDAGLEVLTEEIPLDRIIKQAEIAPDSLTQWLKESAKSAAIEMGEEGTNFIGSAIAQSVILRDKSEYNQNIAQLMMQGVDYQKAKAAADREMVMQGAMTLIESAMSGGMMGGAAQAVGAAKAKGLGWSLDRDGVRQEDINAVIREGLAQDPKTAAYQVAQQMQQKLEKGKSLSQYDLGRLYQSAAMTGQTGQVNAAPAQQTSNDSGVMGQKDNTPMQTDNTGVQSDGNAVQSVQTGEQADRAAQTAANDIMQTEQESVVVAKDEVPLEELGAENAAMLGRLERITGRKVHAYTKPKGLEVVENGFFLNGEIWINTDGDLPHLQVFSHELTHSVEGSKLYGTLKEIALEKFAQGVDIDNYRAEQRKLYEANGQTATEEEIDAEIVADFVSKYLLRDEKTIRDLAKKQRPIATRILNWIDRMLVKYRGSEKAEERLFLRNTRQLYAQALKETTGIRYPAADSQSAGNSQTNQTIRDEGTGTRWTERAPETKEEYRDWVEEMYRNGDMPEEEYEENLEQFMLWEDAGELKKKFSYAGQGARNADLQSLDTARKMEEQEVSAETIRQQTGWFRGDDGKWRFDTGTDIGTQEAGVENKKTPSGVDGEGETDYSGKNPKEIDGRQFSLSSARNTDEETAVGETVRQNLNKKGTNYLNGVERRLMNQMADSLGVPRTVQRKELMPTLQKLVDGYLEGGRIDPEQERQLYDEIMDKAMMTNTLFYDTYKDVKDWLRSTRISIGQEDSAQIPDYANFKKQAFGNVMIVKEGMPVADAYRQLNQRAPELFPESITKPSEQLQRMYQVSHSIAQSKQSLDDYYGENAETAKQWFRNEMENALMDVMPDLRDVRGYADREKARRIESANVPKTVEEALDVGNALRKARKDYEKIRGKMLIDDTKEQIIGKLLRGEMSPEDLKADVYQNMKPGQLLQLYEAKKAYEDLNKRMSVYKSRIKQKLRDEADSVLTDIIDWKDKPMGLLYARETMQRNVLDIVKYRAQGEKINQMYFEPVQIHEAQATRFKNDMRSMVANMKISTEVKKGDKISESAATQIVGEAMDAIGQLGKIKGNMKIGGITAEQWQGVIDGVFAENPSLNPEKIRSNVESFRKIYDDLFQKMNEVRLQFGYEPVPYRTGYFPHFSEETVDNMLVRMGFGIGVELNADALPTSINGLTSQFKPGIQWFGNTLERKSDKTTYDAVKGFDKYIEGVANVIYHTEDIQKLRALESQIRYLSTDDGIRKQVDEVMADTRLKEDEKQDKIDRIYKHGRSSLSNFVNELMEYTNLLAGKKSRLDRGVEAMLGRKIYSIMKKVEGKLGANMIAGNLGSAITNFIPLQQAAARLDRGTLLEGMWDSLRNMKQGDDFVYRSDFLTNRRGSEALVQTGLERVSGALGKPMEWIDGFTSESIVRAAYKQNIRRGLSESEAMHQADLFAASVMADRSKGAMPTLFESRNPLIKAFTQFQLEVNNQFSEVFKDMPRQAAEEGAAVLAAMLMKYFLLAYLFNDTYEKFTGRRSAMDPMGILNDTVGDFTGYQLPNVWDGAGDLISGEGIDFSTEKVNGQKVLQNLAENVAGQMPFSSVLYGGRIPVSSAIPSFDNLTKLNNEDIADEKKRQIALTEAQKLGYLVAPFGYGQAQKTWKGVKALLDGGSYTVNNEGEKQLQYPIFQEDMTPGQVLQAAVMGKSSLPQAQQWAENGYKGLNAKQTALYQDLIDAGTKDKVAYDVIQKMAEAEKTEEKSKNQNMLEVLLGMDLSPKARAMTYERSIDKSKTKTFMEENRDNEEVYTTAPEVANAQAKENETVTIAKIREIQRADISDDAKAALYYGMVASDETRELMDKMTDEGASGAEVAKTLMQIQDADRLKGTEKSTAKRNAIADSNLEEEHKLELYRKKISDDKEDEIAQFRAAGMDLDTFIEVQNEYSRIKDTGKKASQQAQDLSHWLEKQNLTDRQKKTARECFTFYSMVPADAKYFNKAVEAGVDADKAYDVINKMTALKPKAGSTYVSDAQKLRVIVDSGLSEKDMVKMVQSTSIGNTMKTRLPILLDNGVSITKQLQFWEKIFDFDADGSGKLNQREVRACLDSFPGGNNNPLEALMGITSSSGPAWTTAEKAAMWQSYNKQFSVRKNPYDRKVGEKVKADITAAGEKDKEPEKTQKTETQSNLSWMGGSTGNAELDRIIRLR